MNAGELRTRARLQRRVDTADGAGGSTTEWQDLSVCWASIECDSGREFFQQKALLPLLSHLVTIRYRRGVDATQRVVVGPRVLTVLSAADKDNRREWLTLACQEIATTEAA